MRAVFFMILVLFLSACTPSGSSTSPAPTPERKIFEGDIYAEAQRIYAEEKNLYSCDLSLKEKVIEISKAIEENRSIINALAEKRISEQTQEEDVEFYSWGGFRFYNRSQASEINDEWEQDNEGWDEAYELFQKIRNDKNNLDWLTLNRLARSLISEDADRIVARIHPGLRRLEAERVERIFSAVDQCEKNPSCVSLNFERNDFYWLMEGLWHSRAYSDINDDKSSSEDRRIPLKWLHDQMQWSLERYQIYFNRFINVKDNELTVPINLKAFGSDAQKIIKIIEESWSQHGLKIKLLLSDKPEALEVLVKDLIGERPYVSWEKNQMVLFEPVSLKTLVHEFGHVLGLRDRYYTSFDPKKCAYLYEVNRADIMSGSFTGQVLPSHIEQIKKTYGIKDVTSSVSPEQNPLSTDQYRRPFHIE